MLLYFSYRSSTIVKQELPEGKVVYYLMYAYRANETVLYHLFISDCSTYMREQKSDTTKKKMVTYTQYAK